MKRVKHLSFLLVLALMIGQFAGCGGQSEETYTSSEPTEEIITESTTEPTEEITTESTTEPVPTEVHTVYADDFYVGDHGHTYDEQGNLIRKVSDYDMDGIRGYKRVEDYKYDENGNLTWYARNDYNPDGSIYINWTEEYFCQMYGSENRIIKEYFTNDTSEYTVEYTYNPQGILTDVFYYATDLDFSDEGTTKYEYNDRGLLIKSHTLSVATNGTVEYTDEYEYNSQDLLIKAHSTEARSNGNFYEHTTEYEYNDQGAPISVYTLETVYKPIIEAGEERTNCTYDYTYDETGKCIMVECVRSFNGREFSREQFQCDDSGYIYDNFLVEQIYPISLPSVDYPELPYYMSAY